jgi:hypothetical protein
MDAKRQSLELDTVDWQALAKIAHACRCTYRGKPSWRRLVHQIASGKLLVLPKPDKRILAFQETMRVKCRSAVIKSAIFWPNWHPKVGRVYDPSVSKVPSAPSCFFLKPF